MPVLEPLPAPSPEAGFDFLDAPDERSQLAHLRVVDPADARNYRLYVGRGEIVGVFMGSDWAPPIWMSITVLGAFTVGWGAAKGTLRHGDLTDVAIAGAVGAAVGAVGGAIAGAMLGRLLRPFTKADDERQAERLEQLGSKPLSVLRRNHEFNFAIRARDIEGAEITVPSFWFRCWHPSVPHIALLKLYLRDQDDRVLALSTLSDVRNLVRLIGEMTGCKVRTQVGL